MGFDAALAFRLSPLQPNICLLLQEACTISLDDAFGRRLEIRQEPRGIVPRLSGDFMPISCLQEQQVTCVTNHGQHMTSEEKSLPDHQCASHRHSRSNRAGLVAVYRTVC